MRKDKLVDKLCEKGNLKAQKGKGKEKKRKKSRRCTRWPLLDKRYMRTVTLYCSI